MIIMGAELLQKRNFLLNLSKKSHYHKIINIFNLSIFLCKLPNQVTIFKNFVNLTVYFNLLLPSNPNIILFSLWK